MTNRRLDAIYFALVVVVAAVGYVAANRTSDDGEISALPDYSPAPLIFDVPFEPFELPFHFVKFKRVTPPTLALSSNVESALIEVRAALLEGSALVEIPQAQPLLAARE